MKYFLIFVTIFGLFITAQAQTSADQDPLQKYEEDVRLHPDSAEAWYRLGEFDRQRFTRSKAKAAYEKAIELKPDYAEAYNGLGLWYQAPSGCGNTYTGWNQEDREFFYGTAIELHKKAIQLKPNYTEAYVALGNAYRRLKRHEEALNAYEHAVSLNSLDTTMYQNLAETYENSGRYEAAIDSYQRAINQSRDYQRRVNGSPEYYRDRTNLYLAYHHLADLYRKIGRYEEVRDTYKQIIELGIDSSDTHYELGLTYINLGDKRAAQDEYNILKRLLVTEKINVLTRIVEKQANDLLEQINKQ